VKRLDLILLRAPGEALEPLCGCIRESITRGDDHGAGVTLYRRRGLDTDLAVHVHGPGLSPAELSDLSRRIASELRAWGLVEHSSWEEIE
jgi:hypothetical protein